MSGERYGVGLDAGSSETRCMICAVEDGRLRYLGHSAVESGGWQKGRISDQATVAESIRRAVAEAEKQAGISVDGAVVGIGGGTIEGCNSRGLYEFGRPREVDAGDLHYAVELASRVRLPEDRTLLQVAPQDFIVDGRAGYRNPKGVVCARLEANVHIISVSSHDHQTLINAVHQAHLAVEETIFEPLAAAYASLVQEERARGVAIVDIGAHSTDIAIYEGDALLRAVSIPVSADHFTRDVASCLTVSYEDAESLKRQHGCAVQGLTSENSLIELPSAEGRAPREAPRKLLNEILEARAEELFMYLRSEIARARMEQSLYEGILMTGGGALLTGICDMAERICNCQSRNGLPVGIEGWPEQINDTSWCVAAGLAMYSAKLKTRREWKRAGPGPLGWF